MCIRDSSGTAQEGQLLTATAASANDTADTTVSYQWQSSTDGGSTWSNISGETSSSRTVTAAAAGALLHIVATTINPDGLVTLSTSLATGAVIDIAPTLTTSVITGTAQEGQLLTATAASANDTADTTVSYQWQSSTDGGSTWSNISGETSLTHTVTEADEGALLHIVATTINPDGLVTSSTSLATGAVIDIAPTLTTPGISGTAQEGQLLTATAAIANDTADTTVSYQWQSSTDAGSTWSNISGETSLSHTVTEADEGALLHIVATTINPDGLVTSSTSLATGAIIDIAPTLTTPVISGTAQEGQLLTATAAIANDTADTTVSYQWQSSTDGGSTWSNISGETSLSHTC